MIDGVGIDSIEIKRVANKCKHTDSRFVEKMFTEHERYRSAQKKVHPYEHLAACFAAREAFFKATQIWYRRSEVSVAEEESGKPYYVLSERVINELGSRTVHLSLTHDSTTAQAICICEK